MEGSFSISSCVLWNWGDAGFFFWPMVLSFSCHIRNSWLVESGKRSLLKGKNFKIHQVSLNIGLCLQIFYSGPWRVNLIIVKSFSPFRWFCSQFSGRTFLQGCVSNYCVKSAAAWWPCVASVQAWPQVRWPKGSSHWSKPDSDLISF